MTLEEAKECTLLLKACLPRTNEEQMISWARTFAQCSDPERVQDVIREYSVMNDFPGSRLYELLTYRGLLMKSMISPFQAQAAAREKREAEAAQTEWLEVQKRLKRYSNAELEQLRRELLDMIDPSNTPLRMIVERAKNLRESPIVAKLITDYADGLIDRRLITKDITRLAVSKAS